MTKQILTYAAILISLPIMILIGSISGLIAGAAHVTKTWPEQLYDIINEKE